MHGECSSKLLLSLADWRRSSHYDIWYNKRPWQHSSMLARPRAIGWIKPTPYHVLKIWVWGEDVTPRINPMQHGVFITIISMIVLLNLRSGWFSRVLSVSVYVFAIPSHVRVHEFLLVGPQLRIPGTLRASRYDASKFERAIFRCKRNR